MAALRSDPPALSQQGGWLRLAVVVLLVWGVVAVVWASRPITDEVPLTPRPAAESDVPDTLAVQCNSFLSSSARDDTPLPTPPEGFSLSRTPCESQHTEGRILLGINLLVVVVGLALVIPPWRRQRRHTGS
jgi:hypothetical protein